MSVDDQLRAIAVRAADRYPDTLLTAQGWTRQELVDAIHARLRTKYVEARRDGGLIVQLDNTIGPADGCPTPLKRRYTSRSAAKRSQRRHPAPGAPLYPYECPCGVWHLTHQTPEDQRRIGARIAAKGAAPTGTTQRDMNRPLGDSP